MRPTSEKCHPHHVATTGQVVTTRRYVIRCWSDIVPWTEGIVMETAKAVTADPGFYLQTQQQGFVVHILACRESLQRLRRLMRRTLAATGVVEDVAENVQLVASELVGNAVRACGDAVPLVVAMFTDQEGVWVTVHDPDGGNLPCRREITPDDDRAEGGRGLHLIDILAPDWQVVRTPVGKQVRCRLPFPGDRDV